VNVSFVALQFILFSALTQLVLMMWEKNAKLEGSHAETSLRGETSSPIDQKPFAVIVVTKQQFTVNNLVQ